MQKNHELTSSVITRANSLPYIHSQMVLPDSVTGIAAEAFMKRNCIESIHMPMHLQRIGLRAFSGCFGLTSVQDPDLHSRDRAGGFFPLSVSGKGIAPGVPVRTARQYFFRGYGIAVSDVSRYSAYEAYR